MNRKAIATLVIGEQYVARWKRCCEAGWRAYAERHGYDLLVWTSPLDGSGRAASRSVAWQKCLIPGREEAARYDRIVWLDSDVIVNPNAPDICDCVPLDAVGAIDENAFPTPEIHRQIIQNEMDLRIRQGRPDLAESWRCFLSPRRYYESWGVPGRFGKIVQTGVLVISPAHHRAIFDHVYNAYEDKGGYAWNYEMRPLSYEIQRASPVYWLDHRFNSLMLFLLWYHSKRFSSLEAFLQNVLPQCHMAHFAGVREWMDIVHQGDR